MPFSSLLRGSSRRAAFPSRSRPLRGPLWLGGLLLGWMLSGWLLSGCQGEPSNLVSEVVEAENPAPAESASGVVIELGAEEGPSHIVDGFSSPELVGARRA